MKNRVALAATLVTFAIVVILAFTGAFLLVNERNEELSGDLESASTLISQAVQSGMTGTESFSLLADYLSSHNIDVGVYGKDGAAIIATERSAKALDVNEIKEGSRGYEIETEDSGVLLCYSTSLENGDFVRLTTPRMSRVAAVTSNVSFIHIIMCLVICVIYGGVLVIFGIKRRLSIERLMSVLDSFSDGRFDARLEEKDGFSSEAVAEYNSILSRIDERVFNQRSRNQALSVVMNQMQNGIIAVDDQMRVILVTPVAKQLLGITGNPQGMHINDASQDVRLDTVLSDAMNQGGVYTNEVAARTAAGRGHRPLRLYVSPMRKDNQVVGALAMVEDITELRRLEQVRTDFAANVSHELKTPLTSIRGFVETLLDGAIENPEMAKKFLNIIMLETERLTRLINDILSISKLESGLDDVPKERIRLDKEAFDVTEMLSIHAKEKEITLNCHMNSEPVYVIGNKDQLEQMLINLIENGIKYNKPGGSVSVQVFANDSQANLSIADTGIGIADEHQSRLFERFYRVDKGRSRSMGGTGLGLAIVKHIIRIMKGNIEVHSKLGEGTEFLITLPLAPKEMESSDNTDNDID